VLVALLCSDDTEQRVFAVDTIMALRAESEHGFSGMRSFKVPVMVNLDACDLRSLIDWKAKTITETVNSKNVSGSTRCIESCSSGASSIFSTHSKLRESSLTGH